MQLSMFRTDFNSGCKVLHFLPLYRWAGLCCVAHASSTAPFRFRSGRITHEFWSCVLFERIRLKSKYCHFDESFITGCTGNCPFENLRCSQWWQLLQNHMPVSLWRYLTSGFCLSSFFVWSHCPDDYVFCIFHWYAVFWQCYFINEVMNT